MELIGTIIYGILSIFVLIAFIYTLVYQVKKNEWLWFVLTLLLPFVMFVYWIVYPKRFKKLWK